MRATPPDHPTGDAYQARFDALDAAGHDVHGEAAFLLGLDPAPVSLLDAGCGTGRVAIEVHRRGVEVVGVDRDADMLATAARVAPDLRWVHADLAGLDLGRTFDVVVLAGNVLLFVAPGTETEVVARCAAHLDPGGRLVAGFSVRAGGYTPSRLDIDAVGLELEARWSTWDRRPWSTGDDYAVSVLRVPR